ncbi:MAG: tetratricopeptide repeat protein [Thermoanaerobaculia bacterium]|nr:tetratricopeptide repeat protein [Thermoanaerobaculia bacterium]
MTLMMVLSATGTLGLPLQERQFPLLELIEAERWSEAEAGLRERLESSTSGPSGPSVEYLLGYVLSRQYRCAEALPYLESAIEARPDRPRWLHTTASCLLELSRCSEALRVLDQALDLEDLASTHYNKATCARNIGDTPLAVSEFSKVLERDPNHAAGHFQLGELLADSGEDSTAEVHFLRALALRPTLTEAHYRLGLLYLRAERTDEAIAEFKAVLEVIPGHAGAAYGLGRSLANSGEGEESRRTLQRFQRLSEIAEVIENRVQYLQSNPTDVTVRLEVAGLLLAAGRTREAIPHLEAARQLDPNNPETRSLLDAANERLGLGPRSNFPEAPDSSNSVGVPPR